MAEQIQPTADFKTNLSLIPSIDHVKRIELWDRQDTLLATIESVPGKKGSVAVYHYIHAVFGVLNAQSAQHALDVFAEHTMDARQNPGAHPNIDRLLDVISQNSEIQLRII